MLAPEPLTQRAATVRERPAAFEWAGRSLTVAARDAIRSSARIKWNPYYVIEFSRSFTNCCVGITTKLVLLSAMANRMNRSPATSIAPQV